MVSNSHYAKQHEQNSYNHSSDLYSSPAHLRLLGRQDYLSHTEDIRKPYSRTYKVEKDGLPYENPSKLDSRGALSGMDPISCRALTRGSLNWLAIRFIYID